MNRKNILIWILMIVSLTAPSQLIAGNWSNWRGPNYNGSAADSPLPASFTTTDNVLWSTPLPGPSAATPIIYGDRVFISSTDDDSDALLALCFDAQTGKELWRKRLSTATRKIAHDGTMAVPSPVTDGKMVFFMYDSGALAALDMAGKIIWQRDLEKDFGSISIKFGAGSSPLLHADKLYIPVLRHTEPYRGTTNYLPLDSFLLAIDAKTGKDIFKHIRTTDATGETLDAYSSPVLFKNGSKSEILLNGADLLTSHNPDTGAELWRYCYNPQKKPRWRTITSAVPIGDLALGLRPRGKGIFAVKPGKGLLTDSSIAWRFDQPTPDSPTPLYYRSSVYVLKGQRKRILTCLNAATGKIKWQGNLESSSPYYASPTAADGKIYFINEAGEAIVIKAGGDKLKILSRFNFNDKHCYSSVAITDGRLFIRTAHKLYCIGNQ